MSVSDALCLSSKWEGLPIVILEAFSFGLTVLATPVGGVPDVVVDGDSGLLSTGLQIEEYHHLLQRFLSMPSASLQLIRNKSHQLFEGRFDIQITATNYILLYTRKCN